MNKYSKDLQPFVEKLRKYSKQVKIQNFEAYISDRKWKLKPLGDREQMIPKVAFKSELSDLKFKAELADSKHSIMEWLPALCSFSVKDTADGFEGELNFKKEVFPYRIKTI